MTPPEKEIWHEIQLNNPKAFETVFKQYYALLCKYALSFLKSEDIAEETVQEIFVDIWERRESININISLKAYLFRPVHNRCINRLKKLVKIYDTHPVYDYSEIPENPDLNGSDENQPTYIFYDGIEEDLENAIQSLPDQCRIIFMMCRFKSMQYQEIASQLNISVNTVKTQLQRALEKLRKTLIDKAGIRT
jgi:RNA polymerase sigma-70 factor (ECF subfamily)